MDLQGGRARSVYSVHDLMRDKKKEASKVKQATRQIKQHSTPKAVTFPKKNELPQVGLKPMYM